MLISVSFWSLVESCLIGIHTTSSFFCTFSDLRISEKVSKVIGNLGQDNCFSSPAPPFSTKKSFFFVCSLLILMTHE